MRNILLLTGLSDIFVKYNSKKFYRFKLSIYDIQNFSYISNNVKYLRPKLICSILSIYIFFNFKNFKPITLYSPQKDLSSFVIIFQ